LSLRGEFELGLLKNAVAVKTTGTLGVGLNDFAL
jgi:hypothetical protein